MNIRIRYLLIFVLCVFTINTSFIFQVSCEKSQPQKIRDILNLTNKMEVIIDGVYYQKEDIHPLDKGKEIEITKEQLRELLLEKAVVVSGDQINYWFGFETVCIYGIIDNGPDNYYFEYNLAGFGSIFLENNQFIEFGDMSKTVPEDIGE